EAPFERRVVRNCLEEFALAVCVVPPPLWGRAGWGVGGTGVPPTPALPHEGRQKADRKGKRSRQSRITGEEGATEGRSSRRREWSSPFWHNSSLLAHGFGQSPEFPLPTGERDERGVEVVGAEVGPEGLRHPDLGVGDLPEQEVAHAHLARRADQQIRV